MKVALDTNAYADWRRGTAWAEILQLADEVHMCTIVYGELCYGFACGSQEHDNLADLKDFLAHPNVFTDFITPSTCTHYAEAKKYLRQQGKPIPENDLWIAASSIEHGALLLTNDRYFELLPQVRVKWPES